MSDWESDLEQSSHPQAPQQQQQQQQQHPSSLTRLTSKQRRTIQTQQLQQPDTQVNDNDPITPTPTQQYSYRAQLGNTLGANLGTPRQQQNRPSSSSSSQNQQQEDDPFAVHNRTPQQQSFIHPLMQEPLRMPSSAASHDPMMQRISSSLRDSLTRDASTFIPPPINSNISGGGSFGYNKTLPPLSRPIVPPLRLNEVIQRVRGSAATSHLIPLTAEEQANVALRDKVARMKLHEHIAPEAAGVNEKLEQAQTGLDPERAAYVDSGVTVEYDENDDDAPEDYPLDPSLSPPSLLSHPPLLPTPRKNLPTSRLPIDPSDLARKPEDLKESYGGSSRDELMRFRRNEVPVNQTMGGVGNINNNTLGNTQPLIDAKSKTLNPAVIQTPEVMQQQSQDTYVESKTTGEFIRVKHSDNKNIHNPHDSSSHPHISNIHAFDAHIDSIIYSVHSIQLNLQILWLSMLGLLCGCCLIQVYGVYLRKNDIDFLSYYSILAGPARKVIYVLLGISMTLGWWRFLLEREDKDRHEHYNERYYIPNRDKKIWWRNIISSMILTLAFILTLVMIPIDDYIENQWVQNPIWYTLSAELPSYFTSRITSWYIMTMVRLICVMCAWICIIWRFGYAEFHYLQLEQEKYEQQSIRPGVNTNFIPLTARTLAPPASVSIDPTRLTHRAASLTSTTGGLEVSASTSARR